MKNKIHQEMRAKLESLLVTEDDAYTEQERKDHNEMINYFLEKTKVMILVEGGVVQNTASNRPDVNIVIVDIDNIVIMDKLDEDDKNDISAHGPDDVVDGFSELFLPEEGSYRAKRDSIIYEILKEKKL